MDKCIKKTRKIPLKETLEILELSYCGLEDDYKEIFLDVACILKGWEKERAIRALESCDLHARSGLRVLEQKSLITLSSDGCLGMHDHIVEMGKNIVHRTYPNIPYKHSRLWIKEEVEDILINDKGTKATRCIKVGLLEPVIVTKGLRKMKELGILEVNGTIYDKRVFNYDNIDEDSLHLPNSLQYICWIGYPFTCLPKTFLANNLVGLEMSKANIDQLWKGGEKKVLKKLRFIDLRYCKLSTLDVGLTVNLERLCLEHCSGLVELHMPIKSCKLKHLSIHGCPRLKTINRIRNPETLNLVCEHVVELHMLAENPKPKSINLFYSKLRTLDLGLVGNPDKFNIDKHEDLVEVHLSMPKIRELSLRQCTKVKTINLKWTWKLEMLYLEECRDLVELHLPPMIHKLKEIEIYSSNMRTLDLTGALKLKKLRLLQCEDLLELRMPFISDELKTINIGCSKLRTLYLGLSSNLEHLDLHGCYKLVEIHAPVGNLSSSVRFKPCLANQGCPIERSFAELHIIATSIGIICPLHRDFNLPKFHFECVYKEFQLSTTGNLAKLISFDKCVCLYLERLSRFICGLQLRKLTLEGSIPHLPRELDQLESLEELSLLSTKIEHFPDSILMLKCLKFLQFKSCQFLKQLPGDIGRLEGLEELHLTDCTSLGDIPNSICEMKRLKCFHLTNCILVDKLPKEMGRLKSLKELNIQGTSIADFPPSIFELEDLVFLVKNKQINDNRVV